MTAIGSSGRLKRTTSKIQVPALTIAAWYDIFQGGSLRNYMGMRDHAGTEAARNGQQPDRRHRRPLRLGPNHRRGRFRPRRSI